MMITVNLYKYNKNIFILLYLYILYIIIYLNVYLLYKTFKYIIVLNIKFL